MATYTLRYATNLAADPLAVPIPAQLARGDSDAYVFEAQVYDSRDPQESVLAGTVSCSVVRPDGGTVTFLGEKDETTTEIVTPQGTFDATVCRATLPQAALAYPGRVNIAIRLIDGTEETTVLNVSAVVVRTATDTAIDPGEVVPNLEELLAKIEDCEDATEAANDAAAAATTAMAGAVRFDQSQTISDGGTVARSNIGAVSQTDHVSLDNRVNALHGLVNYGYDTDGHLSTTANHPFTVDRVQTQVAMNSTSATSGTRYMKLTGEIGRTTSTGSTGVDGWTGGVTLTSGHIYIIRGTLIGGSVTITGDAPYLSVYEVGTHNTLNIERCAADEKVNTWRKFKAGSTNVNVSFNIPGGVTFTNAVYQVTLEDITYGAAEDGNFAPVDTPTATSTHTTGSLLMMGGQLYQATSAIPVGDTITPGSSGNVTATSIAALFTPTVGAPTYVNNSYIENVNFASSYYYKYPIGIAIVSIRFAVTTALTSTNVKFGELGFTIPVETRVSLANQSGTGSCLLTIGTDGSISACAYGTSKPSGWGVYNACITLPTT